MTVELNEEQRQALDSNPATRLIDPRTRKQYVLLPAEVYERLQASLFEADAGLDMKQTSVLIDQVMQFEDANDPTLDFYQRKYGTKT